MAQYAPIASTELFRKAEGRHFEPAHDNWTQHVMQDAEGSFASEASKQQGPNQEGVPITAVKADDSCNSFRGGRSGVWATSASPKS